MANNEITDSILRRHAQQLSAAGGLSSASGNSSASNAAGAAAASAAASDAGAISDAADTGASMPRWLVPLIIVVVIALLAYKILT